MITREDLEGLKRGSGDVIGQDGEKIGRLSGLYVDDDTQDPTWVTVKTGLFGLKESFVPLREANMRGSDLVVRCTKDQVKDAPRIDPEGHLEPGEEDRLYRHYGVPGSQGPAVGSRGLRVMTADENLDPIKGDTGSVFDEGGSAYGAGGGSAGLAGTDDEPSEGASEVSEGRGAPGAARQGNVGPKETSDIPGVHDKRRA
ncbi:PRC-barrel domain-containing protein [Sinomonas atrocyanea]